MIATHLLSRSVVSARERKTVMDGLLLINSVLTFAAVLAAWFYRLLEIDIGRLAWMFFVYTSLHLLGSIVTDYLHSRRWVMAWMATASFASILFLAVAWFFAGGVKNPLFLISMIVPVIAAGVLQTGLVLPMALLSIAAAIGSALAQSPELLWTAERLGFRIPFLSGASLAAGLADPVPGVEVTPASVMLILLWFGLAQLGLAMMSRNLAAGMITLTERLIGSASLGVAGSGVTQASLLAATSPTVIVYSDSGQIHLASRSFANQMLVREHEIAGKALYDFITFEDEPLLKQVLRNGGRLRVAYRVGPERRVAEASIYNFHSEGDTFSLVRLDEITTPEQGLVVTNGVNNSRFTGPVAILK